MKLLRGPYGYQQPRVAWVRLERIGGPGAIDREAVGYALFSHSAYQPAVRKIFECLEHSLYECLMRESTAREVLASSLLHDAGIKFSARIDNREFTA